MVLSDVELMQKAIPTKQVVDFDKLSKELSSKEKFRKKVQEICGDDELPLVFPGVPDYIKGKNHGLYANTEAIDSELTLPSILYDSDTYIENPELRGPMEELILGYEKERSRNGLPGKKAFGKNWSETFRERLEHIQYPPVSKTEQEEELESNKDLPKPPLKGEKLG